MVFARIRDWVKRNGTTLVVGAGIIGATYLGGTYVLSRIQEARARAGEDRIAKENLKRRFQQNQEDCTYTVLALLPTVREEIISALPVEQITEQLQQERQERLNRLGAGGSEAPSTEYPSAPASVVDDDSRSLGSSSYVHASQLAQSTLDDKISRPKRSKAQLWQDMKINSIARALTLIYTLCLLTILTRIQLNLLGRRTYLSSVVALAAPPAPMQSSTISLENKDDDNYDNVYGNDFETNRKYLTFSWWLLHRGSKQIMLRVIAAVKDVFSTVNIREDMSLERLSELVLQVRQRVEGATEHERRSMRWLTHLLPSKEDEGFVIRQSAMSDSEDSLSPDGLLVSNPINSVQSLPTDDEAINFSLRRLLDETADLIDSPTFNHVLTRLLDTAFSHLIDFHIATEAFRMPRPAATGPNDFESRITEIADTKCKLAHILPAFCKQAHTIAVGSGELDTIAGVAAQEALGNEYLAAIDRVGDLEAFAAVIYSSNFEYEAPDSSNSSTVSVTASPSPHTQADAGPAPDPVPIANEQHRLTPPQTRSDNYTLSIAQPTPLLAPDDSPKVQAKDAPSGIDVATQRSMPSPPTQSLPTVVADQSPLPAEVSVSTLQPESTVSVESPEQPENLAGQGLEAVAEGNLCESEVLVSTEDAQADPTSDTPNFEAAWNNATDSKAKESADVGTSQIEATANEPGVLAVSGIIDEAQGMPASEHETSAN